MRKILLILLLFPLLSVAQNKFAFYSHSEALESVPGYRESIAEYELLKQRCDAEIERNEQELTRKYVAFLDGQQDFPELILRKRQKELQQMVDNSVLFRDQLKQWLKQAKDSLLSPHNATVDAALEKVCLRKDLAYAINSDEVKLRYVNPNIGVEITDAVIDEILNPEVEEPEVTECAEDVEPPVATDVVKVATDVVTVATDTVKVATDSISVAVDPIEAVSDSITVATDSLTDSINSVVESVEVKEEKK